MKIGVTIHATDKAMDPAALAREAEARGFDSFYIPEHTHIPTSRRTPAPTGRAELGEEYARSPDPYIALAAAAAVTSKIRLGTGIGLPAQHDPITFAKQIATLDRVANGRFTFGIGFGWNLEEMENHGVDFKRRRERVRETMLAMQALWSRDNQPVRSFIYLRSERGEFDPDDHQIYVTVGGMVEIIDDVLALGVYGIIPTEAFQVQSPRFADERQQAFTNSLHFELYGDRTATSAIVMALAATRFRKKLE